MPFRKLRSLLVLADFTEVHRLTPEDNETHDDGGEETETPNGQSFVIDTNGVRLDAYLSARLDMTRSRVSKAFQAGLVTLDGKQCKVCHIHSRNTDSLAERITVD